MEEYKRMESKDGEDFDITKKMEDIKKMLENQF
jgi:hypothetical protein